MDPAPPFGPPVFRRVLLPNAALQGVHQHAAVPAEGRGVDLALDSGKLAGRGWGIAVDGAPEEVAGPVAALQVGYQ